MYPAMPNWNVRFTYKGKEFVRIHHEVATFTKSGRRKYIKADYWDKVDANGERCGLKFASKEACRHWVNTGIEERARLATWTVESIRSA